MGFLSKVTGIDATKKAVSAVKTGAEKVKAGAETIKEQGFTEAVKTSVKEAGTRAAEEHAAKVQSADRIKHQFETIGLSQIWDTRKEVKALESIIQDDETVVYATSGLLNGNTVLMVATSDRIIFIDKGLVYGSKYTEIPLQMVNSISYNQGLVFGAISITNGATSSLVKNVAKDSGPKMVAAVNTARKAANNPQVIVNQVAPAPEAGVDAAEELRKFKSLLDDGIISQDEFDAKKKEILGL